MTDRKLGRGAVAVLAGVAILLLAFAGRMDGYWQALLINLGTGVLLFVALEHALYGPAERLTALIASALQSHSDPRLVEMWNRAQTLSAEARNAVASELQATSPLPATQLQELERSLRAVDQMDASEQAKGTSYVALLSSAYGAQRVQQLMVSSPSIVESVPARPTREQGLR